MAASDVDPLHIMKRLFSVLLTSAFLLSQAIGAVQTYTNNTVTDFYYNYGNSSDSPPIDALNFVNYGTFNAVTLLDLNENGSISSIFSLLPFETSDTQNYTNTGTMTSSVGYRFRDNPASYGVPMPSRSFFNGPNAVIDAPYFLLAQATNIVNKGLLRVGVGGVMGLTGNAVDLSESLLQVPSLADTISFSGYTIFDTNIFFPAAGVYDIYWSSTNLARFSRQINVRTLLTQDFDGTLRATTPSINSAPLPSQAVGSFSVPAFGSTNVMDSQITVLETTPLAVTTGNFSTNFITVPSNIVKQAVFVAVPPGFDAKILFDGDELKEVNVLISTGSIDPITGVATTNTIRFGDTLAASRIARLLQNFDEGTYRPTNYTVDRLGNLALVGGLPGNNGIPSTNFFVSSGSVEAFTNLASYIDATSETVTNSIVTNGLYAAYGAFIDNVVSRPPNVSGGTFTNLPGSVRIISDNLNLDDAKIRAQGQISLHATHLISSTNALLDCDNLSLDIGSTNGFLMVDDLVPPVVHGRIKGNIYAWSGLWTNTVTMLITNNYTTNGLGAPVIAPLTNTVSVIYHTLILDASSLANTLQTQVYDLNTHAKNIFINDDMTLLSSLFLDARSVTLNSTINVPGVFPIDPITGVISPGSPLTDWVSTNAPTLLFLTNNGSLTMPSTIHLGDDRPRYAAIVNHGALNGASILADTWYLANFGSLNATRLIQLQFDTAIFGNGFSSSGNATRLTGNNLVFTNFQLLSDDALDLRVSGILTDAGSTNLFSLNNGGINLRTKPITGDLLGTTVVEFAPKLSASSTINHFWAAEDRGPVVEGFINNGALGRLILSAATNFAKFHFIPADGANALYVDELDFGSFLSNADAEGNMTNVIIDPNMTIYYAQATAEGVSIAEKLNGRRGLTANGGRFVWVSDYAGTFSGTNLTYDGGATLLRFNRALVQSQNIDSDNDGTVNFFDSTPLPPEMAFTNVAAVPEFPALPFPAEFGTDGSGFAAAAGSYNGLFYTPEMLAPDTSGYFSAKTTAKGQYTAHIRLGRRTYSFSGKFNEMGYATNFIRRSPFEVDLQIDLNGGDRITGIVTDGDFRAQIQADRLVFNKRRNPATQAGTYTLVIPGKPGDPNSPEGSGYGTAKVDANGHVVWSGVLAGGTKVTQRSAISGQGIWPLYASLYRGEGSIVGWIQFSDQVETDLQGQAVWLKPDIGGQFYPGGFALETSVMGAKVGGRLNLTNGVAVLTGGNLNEPITNSFTLNKKFKAVRQEPNQFSLSINPKTGLFKGSVLDPDGGKISFKGAWLKKASGTGLGYFFGFDEIGEIELTPAP